MNTDHLNALKARFYSECERLMLADNDMERNHRRVLCAQIGREIDGEYKFLGIERPSIEDDEILAALMEV